MTLSSPPDTGAPPVTGPPARPRYNAFAIAAFVLSFFSALVVAIAFAVVALVQVRRNGQRGRGLAIAALAVSGAWIAVWAVIFTLAFTGQVDRDQAGRIVKAGDLELTEIRAGDCLDGVTRDEVPTTVRGVPCAQPHDAEVFGVFDLPDGRYPDESTLTRLATSGCDELRAGYSTSAASDPTLQPVYLTPIEEDWPRDRRVVCLLFGVGKQTGSLRDR